MGNYVDITGKIFGTLKVDTYLGNSKWKCTCLKCGNEVKISTSSLNSLEKLKRDGCKHAKAVKIGDVFGYLTVLKAAEPYTKPKSGRKERQWLCRCQCGREKVILEDNLKSLKSTSCGKCSNRISIPEKTIYYYLSKCFSDIEENYRPNFLEGREIDIFIPSIKVGIEYDGERWHKDLSKDLEKEKLCKNNFISLIHIREPNCPTSNDLKYVIVTPKPTTNATHMTEPIKKVIDILNFNFQTDINLDVDCLKDNAEISKLIMNTAGFNSLASEFPDIAKEWNYDKNSPLVPDRVPAHSGKKAYWICPKGHQYSSVIASRTGEDRCGCPICANKGMALYQDGNYIGEHSLLKYAPEIAKEFDEIKNGISADNIAVASNKKMWWKCKECGYEWQAKVNNRTSNLHTGCPKCAKLKNKSARSRQEHLVKVRGSLRDNCPELCKEWDYKKNTDILPDRVTKGSSRKVYWICPKGHSYLAMINKRAGKYRTGCPICRGRKQPNINN